MNKNIERVIEKMELVNAEDLQVLMDMMPEEYKHDFAVKWGITGSDGKYCNTYTLLAKKLGCTTEEARDREYSANHAFLKVQEYQNIFALEDGALSWESFRKACAYISLIKAILGVRELPQEFKIRSVAEIIQLMDELTNKILPDRERMIITMRFGLEDGVAKTLEDVSQRYKEQTGIAVTRERVRSVEAKSLRKLRGYRHAILTNSVLVLNDELNKISYNVLTLDGNLVDELEVKLEDVDGLDYKVYRILKRAGIKMINDLAGKSVEDIQRLRMGRRGTAHLLEKMVEWHLLEKRELDPEETTTSAE